MTIAELNHLIETIAENYDASVSFLTVMMGGVSAILTFPDHTQFLRVDFDAENADIYSVAKDLISAIREASKNPPAAGQQGARHV